MSLSHPPEMPHVAPQHHPESQLGSKLIALVKATSDALRGIALVAEKLVHWANAERNWLTGHKGFLGVYVGTRVEMQCALSPLHFLPGGVSD